MQFKDFGTPETDALCRSISARSGGVALLAFGRGKDAVAAWLYMREYFKRIIPFHFASVPGLSFAEQSLAYYEREFRTPIIRLMSFEAMSCLHDLRYQPIEDEEAIDALNIWEYGLINTADAIREEYKVPDAWLATGVTLSDSLTRRVIVKERQGKNVAELSFEPCFNWTRGQVTAIIEHAKLKLARDYLMGKSSVCNMPSLQHLPRMLELFPDDFEKVEEMFPFIRAVLARHEFRKNHDIPAPAPVEAVEPVADPDLGSLTGAPTSVAD